VTDAEEEKVATPHCDYLTTVNNLDFILLSLMMKAYVRDNFREMEQEMKG